MQEKFEKNIEEKLNHFSIEPSPQIWIDVEKALHPRRKYRGILWWWVLLAGMLGGITIWQTVPNGYQITSNKISTFPTVTKKSSNEKSNNVASPENGIQRKQAAIVNKSIGHEYLNNEITTILHFKKINNRIDNQDTVLPDSNHFNSYQQVSGKNKLKEGRVNDSIKMTDTVVHTNAPIPEKDSTINQQAKHPGKKRNWFLTVEAGSFHLNNNFTFYPIAQSTYNNAISNGGSSVTANMINPNTGFCFDAGILTGQQLNKHWYFETGIQYSYQHSKQTTGIRIDSITSTSDYYFTTGTNNTVNNYAHGVKIPLLLNYCFHPKNGTSLYLLTGINTEFLLAKKWLVPDNTRSLYFYNASLIKNFQVTAIAGAGIVFKNNIHATVKIEQALTSFYQFNNTNYFKQFFSAQMQFPIRHRAKKK
jgi:hypothetical protein